MTIEPIPVTQQQMNLILMAVEHGFREHERGKNLQGALVGVFDLYRVIPERTAIGDASGSYMGTGSAQWNPNLDR